METTLLKGLAVLEALVQRDGSASPSELAAQLKLTRSNTHRLLNTLVTAGFATVEDGRYAPSLRTWELGNRIIGRYDVRVLARPAMEWLARETREDVRLTTLDVSRIEVVFIEKIESPHVVRTFTAIGSRLPAQSTASGRVLLAHQDPKLIRQSSRKLKPLTRWTIIDPAEFVEQLGRIRRDGYAVNAREYSERVISIAAPIVAPDGAAVASISIAAPADRVSPATSRKFIQLVREAAQRASLAMQSPANVIALHVRRSAVAGTPRQAARTSARR
jgi:IclR family transcriptional regulator, KDG regulon repressor